MAVTQPVNSGHLSVALTDALGTTEEVDYSNYSKGTIAIPSGSSITTLTFHVAVEMNSDFDGPERVGDTNSSRTYYAAYSGATAVTMTVAAARAYDLPSTISGAAYFKIVANAAGTVHVCLKG